MAGISHLKNKVKKLSKESFDVLKGKRQSIVYSDGKGNILWDDKVHYNEKDVLVAPLPMSEEEWEEQHNM